MLALGTELGPTDYDMYEDGGFAVAGKLIRIDKDQRVTHAAITENKHLSAVLEHIKAEQELSTPKPRRAGKQRSRYEPTERHNDWWNSKFAKRAKKRAEAAEQKKLTIRTNHLQSS
ncbi:MAG: hypothetical protein ABJF05_19160 [Paracoccaceae bacterium]